MKKITFYYDIVCPYAYIASQRIEAVAARCGATVDWQPVLLGGIYKSLESAQVPSQTWSAPKVRLGALDMIRQASFHGVSLTMPAEHPRRTVSTMRLLVGVSGALRRQLSHALYRAYWVDGADIARRDVLDAIARANGVDPSIIDSPEARAALFENTAAAVAAGAFGVPAMVVDDVMFWGQDRLLFVERALNGRGPSGLPPTESGKSIRFFHDFSSPFSYLASTQIESVAARHSASVEWCPILLGGLFRSIGTPDVPMLEMTEAKQAYIHSDMRSWAEWWGVPFTFPSSFPIRGVLPLRVAIAEPAVTPHLYRALWVEDRNIGDPEVLAAVLSGAGFNAESLLKAATDPVIKGRLRSNTEEAQAAGACGVPTFIVDGNLIWGQDRLDLLEAYLAGTWSFPA